MVRLTWKGGEHDFALRIGELRRLQDTCEAGPEQVLNRLMDGSWRVDDIIEPIRLGLVGSGEMTVTESGPLVTKLFDQHSRVEFKLTSLAVMVNALHGPEDDMPGEPEGEPPLENGDSAKSTEPEG